MKLLPAIGVILLFLVLDNRCIGQQQVAGSGQIQSLGRYWFVMYFKGQKWQDSTARMKLDGDHINFIVNLRRTGKIITGGAFTDRGLWTGFEIYNCKTKEEVIEITEKDPMVLSEMFSYEIHPLMTLKGMVKFD